MADDHSPKLIIALAGAIFTLIGFYPYFRDILRKQTKPHLYTWLLWVFTQGTATAGLWQGGGGFANLNAIATFILVVLVFLLTLSHGTRNITPGDTVVLVAALLAIAVWWQLHNPTLAVLMVAAIDGLGYIPTFRKTYQEPWTETLSFWVLTTIGCVLTLFACREYNLLTLSYYATLAVANTVVCLICMVRRKAKPSSQ